MVTILTVVYYLFVTQKLKARVASSVFMEQLEILACEQET
jgi:hypothetical protein